MFRTTQITRYIRALELLGIDRDAALLNTGIVPAALNSPDTLITLDQYSTVVANLYRLSGDPGIAFVVGRSMRMSDFGLVGYAMLTARTLRDVIDVWIKYSHALVGQYSQTAWGDGSHGDELHYHSPVETGMLHRFEIEQTIVSGSHIVQELTGVETVYHSIDFSYPEPPYRQLYEQHMKCPLQFNAPRTVVRLSRPSFNAPVRTMNEEIFSICAEHCSKVMTLLPNASALLSRLRSLFLTQPGHLPDQEEASQKLGMSASTLARRLEASGLNYQGIKDEFRYDLAREYLRTSRMPPKKVASLLGFSTPSNFYRAFKAWSGQTVREFLDAQSLN